MIGREAGRVAAQIALVSLASYACGEAITGYVHGASARTGGMWALMSAIVVLQQTRGRSVSVVWRHILATLVGALVAAAYLSVLPFHVIGLAASIFVGVLLSHILRIPGEASLAALAIGVVMVVSSLHPTLHPVLSAALRFVEACVGTVMAALVIAVWPDPAADRPRP